jgi:multicomponent Na+:H+ antiporter subunit A
VTGAGGLALLAGALLAGQVAGGYEYWRLAEAAPAIRAHPLYLPIVGLILIAACTKSAQVPFHFWLPAAMEAPTPVSAYLHSATMVKAGVFLVARLQPVPGDSGAWHGAVAVAGGVTLLTGALLALGQRDLKRLLAYSTVSALGMLMLLLGIGSAEAVGAAMVFLVVHSLYKGALFLVAGAVDHATGTRDVTRLGGLRPALPLLAGAALAAGLSMAGLPPLLGFVGKELIYEATLHAPAAVLVSLAAVAGNALTVTVAAIVVLTPFWRGAATPVTHPPGVPLLLGPTLLAAAGLLLGCWPALAAPLLGAAAGAARGAATPLALALWHGVTPMLALSAITVAAGAALYAADARRRAERAGAGIGGAALPTPTRAYDWLLAALQTVAVAVTRSLQSGSLRAYLVIILTTLVIATGLTLHGDVGWPLGFDVSPLTLPETVICVLTMVAALAAARATSRLAAIAALGSVGYGVSLLFVFFGAPDLALTQFAIETLTVILFVLVIYRLPQFSRYSAPLMRLRDAAVALGVGLLMAALVLVAAASPLPSRLAPYFAAESLAAAHGRNVVNVILVDFRGLDTMGEITVLAIAAIGIWALRHLRGGVDVHAEAPPLEQSAPVPPSLLLRIAARHLFPLLLLFSVFVLLRGHNAPGGGFVGGLVAAAAFALYLLAYGLAAARRLLRVEPPLLIGLGLLFAAGSGLPAVAAGRPFLTALWGHAALPAIGAPGTPLLFDGGVYLVVLGIVLLMLFALSEEAAAAGRPGERR